MTIKTKFNVRDECFFIHNDKIQKMKINQININVISEGKYSELYIFAIDETVSSIGIFNQITRNYNQIFATKEELLKSL